MELLLLDYKQPEIQIHNSEPIFRDAFSLIGSAVWISNLTPLHPVSPPVHQSYLVPSFFPPWLKTALQWLRSETPEDSAPHSMVITQFV